MSPPKKKIKLSENEETSKYDFSTLPYDVLINIFKRLDFKTISRCAILCRKFYNLSNESLIYSKVTFKFSMDINLLENYITKITRPKHLLIIYNYSDDESEPENCTEFEQYLTKFIKKSGEYLLSVYVENCRNETVLSLLSQCLKLTDVSFVRCKGYFESLPTLKNLTRIHLVSCNIPNKVLQDALQNNSQLNTISLYNNLNLNPSDIFETLAKFNGLVEDVRFCANKTVRAKGLQALARCCKLRVLELENGPNQCDPEDSLQQLAAGCPLLERLSLVGWKKVNDDNLIPILHSCLQLRSLDLRGNNITIRSCREAALSLPFLRSLDVYKCGRIKKNEVTKFQKNFQEIWISK